MLRKLATDIEPGGAGLLKKSLIWMFTALFLLLFQTFTPAFASTKHVPQAPSAIYKVDTTKKVVALTFDISWGEKMPGPILNVLKTKNIQKATFFLSGPWIMHHQEIAKQIKSMGYEIGSHGYMHKDFSEQTDNWIKEQMGKAEHSFKEVLNLKPTLVRTPNGDFDQRVLRLLNQMGYTVIQWNTDSLDWKNPGVEYMVSRVTTRAVPGDIILMHASDSAKQTAAALPQIIDGLRAKGYQFVTVSELISGVESHTRVQ